MVKSKTFTLQNQDTWVERDTYGFPHCNTCVTLMPWVIEISQQPPRAIRLDYPQVVMRKYKNLLNLIPTLEANGILEVIPGGLVGRKDLVLCKLLF